MVRLSDEARRLLLEIARCPIARTSLTSGGGDHPCAEIVLSQGAPGLEEHQTPEPWDGDLERAPILFVGSNPPIAPDEDHPTWTWPDDLVVDFHANRFAGGRREWVRDGLYVLRKDGAHDQVWARYWASVRARAAELLDRPAIPGVDYALTAIVRCKSNAEFGVRKAVSACAARHGERTLALAGARVVVYLGKIAADALCAQFGIPRGATVYGPVQVGARRRYVAFLPHPNARKARTFSACCSAEELERLHQFVHG